MDRTRSEQRLTGTRAAQTPAIGIDAVTTNTNVDTIVDTVDRVAQHDTPVLVAVPADSPALHRRLDDTPATIIEVAEADNATRAFATAGKERGLPGVILHPSPGSEAAFEYEESLTTFTASDQYVVAGHATDPTATTSRVAILIGSDHDRETIAQLRTNAAAHFDELLVVTAEDDGADGLTESPSDLPVERIPLDATTAASPVVTALAYTTRHYAHCDAVTLLGADTPTVTDSVAILSELVKPITDGDADLVVGRRVDAAPDADDTTSGGHLSDIIRNALGGNETPRSDAELDDGPIAFTPATARELERRLDRTATRLGVINTAIRADLTVRIHEYTASADAPSEAASHSTSAGPSESYPAEPVTAESSGSASPASTQETSGSLQSGHDAHTRLDPQASDRTLDIVYVADGDTPESEVSFETLRDAVTALEADTELTVTDTRSSVLEHVLNACNNDTDPFLVTRRERSRDVDAVADTLGLDILALPTAALSTATLTETLTQHLDQHPDSQLIIAPGALTHTPDTTRVIAPAVDAAPASPSTTQQSGDVLVGIPAYNEAASIADIVTDAAQYADDVVVVDDASDDDTPATASAAGATVIQHDENRGYGGALNTVFAEAARRNPAHLVILDGDGQHDPSDIPDAVATQEDSEADIVIGSRFETGSETDLPAYRRVGLAVVNTLTNLSMGVIRRESWVNDTQSGFRTYNRRAIRSLHHDDTIGDGMSASTDILYHAHQHDYDLEEIGTTIDYDVEDPSSHNPITHGLTLVANILKTIEHDRPVTSLGVPGFMSAFAGLGFGYWTFSSYIATGNFPLGLAVTSSFFGLAGIFACFTAIILHSLNTHLTDA